MVPVESNPAMAERQTASFIAHFIYRFDMERLENGLVNLINRITSAITALGLPDNSVT